VIVFDLVCETDHRFEGWFRNSAEYQQQLHTGMLTCPVCGSENIAKLPSPSRVNLGKSQQALDKLNSIQHEVRQVADKIQQYVRENFEDVGTEFAQEAKKIHYGEADERNIHGLATVEEVAELHDEGIQAIPLYNVAKPDKDKLN